MPILIEPLKLLYIRVPKTGSTSFINAINHLDPRQIGDVHGNVVEAMHLSKAYEIEDYRRVGFVRHPYDWCRSAYAHWRIHPEMFPECKGAFSLYSFIHRLNRTPLSWLCDADDKLVCEVWRTEDMGTIMPKLGLEVLRKNVRAANNPQPIDAETKRLIGRKFDRVFKIGGYHA